MKIKRTKEIDNILLVMALYFHADKTRKVVDYIELLEGRIKHLERAIGEWQEKTGEKHPTLTGF